MKKFLLYISILFFITLDQSFASPIISGISTNEINIDTKFQGAKILLFGAKGDSGNIAIVVRGPKKNFMVTKKKKLLGIWYNGKRIKFKESYSFYSIFSTFNNQSSDQSSTEELFDVLELGKNNIKFLSSEEDAKIKDEFQMQLIEKFEKNKLYSTSPTKIDFLDETLFKVTLDFPKNIYRGIYSVEIYLIDGGRLSSFQSIPIYVNQVGLSGKILDFAYQEAFLYGLLSVAIALIVGWLTNYIFTKFIGNN